MMKHFLKHGKVLHCSSKVADHWHRICILFATGAPCVSKCKRRARGGKGVWGKPLPLLMLQPGATPSQQLSVPATAERRGIREKAKKEEEITQRIPTHR